MTLTTSTSTARREGPIARGDARARVQRTTRVHRLACSARDVRACACADVIIIIEEVVI